MFQSQLIGILCPEFLYYKMFAFKSFLMLLYRVLIFRSSGSQMFLKIGVLKNFANYTGKHLHWSLFLIKLLAWRPVTLLKKDSNTGVFLWNLRNLWEHLFYRTLLVVDFEFLKVLQIVMKSTEPSTFFRGILYEMIKRMD